MYMQGVLTGARAYFIMQQNSLEMQAEIISFLLIGLISLMRVD